MPSTTQDTLSTARCSLRNALQHISGATGVTLALGEPVTAFVPAILVVGGRPTVAAFAGLSAVLGGLALVVYAEVKARPG